MKRIRLRVVTDDGTTLEAEKLEVADGGKTLRVQNAWSAKALEGGYHVIPAERVRAVEAKIVETGDETG